ncbi:MAG: tyrosine-protein phosphatase [Adlercreutzia equolifaciens]
MSAPSSCRFWKRARPTLRAYFGEIDRLYGSFDTYLREGLHLTDEAIESLRALVA